MTSLSQIPDISENSLRLFAVVSLGTGLVAFGIISLRHAGSVLVDFYAVIPSFINSAVLFEWAGREKSKRDSR